MNQNVSFIIEKLKTLTLLEVVELLKNIEKEFEINTQVVSFSPNNDNISQIKAPTTDIKEEEKTAFAVLLSEVPADKKIAILKVVRNITGLGIKESKEIVDNPPKLIKEGVTKDESEHIKKEIEAVGGKILIK